MWTVWGQKIPLNWESFPKWQLNLKSPGKSHEIWIAQKSTILEFWNGEVTSVASLCWKIELGAKIFTHQHFERHVLEAFSIFSTQVSLQVWDMSTSKTSCMRINRKPPTSPQYIQIRLKETDGGISNELTISAEIETNCIVVCYKITKIVRAFWLVKNPWFIVPVNS